jgi:two-component sensor histidine kinase
MTDDLGLGREDPALSLALAMVVSSTAPLLLLNTDLSIIAASASFCRAYEIEPPVAGQQLFALGQGEWNLPQLRSLMSATLSGDAAIEAYEMDLVRPGRPTRRLVLNVQRLAYGDAAQLRLIVTINDVTDARDAVRKGRELLRANEARNADLAHDNELLLQEIRHRVANSLQIIASVLMQSARRTQSDEVKDQLRDAHNRVMSVAELQQQLAVSTQGHVELRGYLTKLCETIAASMIPDPAVIRLVVQCEDVEVDAGTSVSMGLIVTELVINSLKHGFPANAGGTITVDYRVDGSGWALSVCDDGVGMPKTPEAKIGGLGTSIVQALARQLQARVVVEPGEPGACVSILHQGALAPTPETDPSIPQPAV